MVASKSICLALLLIVAAAGRFAAAGPCVPYQLPPGYTSYQQLCGDMINDDDRKWDTLYRNGHEPAPGEKFPMDGAVLGCLAGRASRSRAAAFGLQAWNGKVFGDWDYAREQTSVTNILSSGNIPAMSRTNWTANGIPSYNWFNGLIRRGNALSSTGGTAYIIDYYLMPGEQIINPYAGLVSGTRDEVRSIGQGIAIGKTWAKPVTTLNPTMLTIDQGVIFVLFQMCTKDGQYAKSASQRDFAAGVAPPPEPAVLPAQVLETLGRPFQGYIDAGLQSQSHN